MTTEGGKAAASELARPFPVAVSLRASLNGLGSRSLGSRVKDRDLESLASRDSPGAFSRHHGAHVATKFGVHLSVYERLPAGFYMNYFQAPGVAEADLQADIGRSLWRLFFANSGDYISDKPLLMVVPSGGSLTEVLPAPVGPLSFMSVQELEVYVDTYRRTGFRGALNGYRVFQKNWELTAPWAGMKLPVPAAYVGGTRDTVVNFSGNRARAEAMGPGQRRAGRRVSRGRWPLDPE